MATYLCMLLFFPGIDLGVAGALRSAVPPAAHLSPWPLQLVLDAAAVRALRGSLPGPFFGMVFLGGNVVSSAWRILTMVKVLYLGIP